MKTFYIIAAVLIGIAMLHEICRWFYNRGYDNGWEDHVDRVLNERDRGEQDAFLRGAHPQYFVSDEEDRYGRP